MTRTLRIALVAVAVAAVAWFALGARQAHEINQATALLDHQAADHPGLARRAASLLSSASFLDPGIGVTLLRVRLDLGERKFADAKALLDRALAAEPDNLSAWIIALDLAIDHPAAESVKRIGAHIRALDPIDAHTFLG